MELPVPASAQFLSIENHTDNLAGQGNCGSPGHRGCSTAPTCTSPADNGLRIDQYVGLVWCELPGDGNNEKYPAPPVLFLPDNTGQIGDTIFTSTDLHFGKSTVSLKDSLNHMNVLNSLASSGVHWPGGVGFTNEAIHAPIAIVTTGDNAHDGQSEEEGAFRLLYEQGWLTESTQFPVLVGLGNHDMDNDCYLNNCAQRMFTYAQGHNQPAVTNFDSGSHSYSWDWAGIHFVQLNVWAGDTELGSGGAGSTHPSGMQWLSSDLQNNVGASNRPVVFFQHFGLDQFSVAPNAPWWAQSDRQNFWNAIQGYNVIAMFTGHQHLTGMYDFNDPSGNNTNLHIDDFVGGTGGEDPGLAAGIAAQGGKGHFFVIRVKPDPVSGQSQFLDVASVEWTSDTSGNLLGNSPSFTNLQSTDVYGTQKGGWFVGGQAGCRKIINSRRVDISGSVATSGSVAGTVTVTNTSGAIIPGPIVLEFTGPDDSVGAINSLNNLTNKAFVDRCASAASEGLSPAAANSGGRSYMYPDNGNTGDLGINQSLTFTPAYSVPNGYPSVTLTPVRYGFNKGSSPTIVNLTGTTGSNGTLPGQGTIRVFGPPNTAFTVTTTISGTPNWISVVPTNNASSFDQYGTASLTYIPNKSILQNDTNMSEIALAVVQTSNAADKVIVPISLQLRTPVKMNFTVVPSPNLNQHGVVNPPYQFSVGAAINVEAELSYQRVSEGYSATGIVNLLDVTNPASPVVLATNACLNIGCDISFPNDVVVVTANLNTPGVRTLEISYLGDGNYGASSATFLVEVGQPTITLNTSPPGLFLFFDHEQYSASSVIPVSFESTHTLATASAIAIGATTQMVFSSWADGPTGIVRTITASQNSATYTANFETQYLVTLQASPANGGAVSATGVSGASGFIPSGGSVTVTATPNAGYYFTGFSGALASSVNNAATQINGPATIVANFAAQQTPVINWPAPAAINFGSALSGSQLDATATLGTITVPGTFAYNPPAGTVLQPGAQTLSVTFTPTSQTYATVTATTTITVNPGATAGPVNLTVTKTLSRNPDGSIQIQLTITNIGGTAAANVALTKVVLGSIAASPLPQYFSVIGPGTSVQAKLTVPGSGPGSSGGGASGTASSLTVAGTYNGGSFGASARVTLP